MTSYQVFSLNGRSPVWRPQSRNYHAIRGKTATNTARNNYRNKLNSKPNNCEIFKQKLIKEIDQCFQASKKESDHFVCLEKIKINELKKTSCKDAEEVFDKTVEVIESNRFPQNKSFSQQTEEKEENERQAIEEEERRIKVCSKIKNKFINKKLQKCRKKRSSKDILTCFIKERRRTESIHAKKNCELEDFFDEQQDILEESFEEPI